MRGRTLNDSFIIMDEAQNCTPEQMKMILTRQGFNSKMVVNGDVTQIDLPTGKRSGLLEAVEVLRGVEGIRFINFDDRDVVRQPPGAANRQGVRTLPGEDGRWGAAPTEAQRAGAAGGRTPRT